MIDLSRCSTPDQLSDHDEDQNKDDDSDSLDFEEKRRHKKYSDYVVRLKVEPQYRRARNKFDSYLTKTQMKAIIFSENKRRWQRIIDKDLYSKTEGRGIPTLQRVELKDR